MTFRSLSLLGQAPFSLSGPSAEEGKTRGKQCKTRVKLDIRTVEYSGKYDIISLHERI
jgi:hypothetical protein